MVRVSANRSLEKDQPLTSPQGFLEIAINDALRNWSKHTLCAEDSRLRPA